MKIKLKETEAQCLSVILNSIPSQEVADEKKDLYRALTKRRKIVKEINEKNKEFSEIITKADESIKEAQKELQVFRNELDDANNIPKIEKNIKEKEEELEEQGKKAPKKLEDEIAKMKKEVEELSAERHKSLKEQAEVLNEKIEKALDDLGVNSYQHVIPTRNMVVNLYIYKDEKDDKEIELGIDEVNGQKEFIQYIIREKALEHIPSLEDMILHLGEKFEV